MASIHDIDTTSAVRKFIERNVVADREDEAVDRSGEVRAILESIAVSFLLHPQAALSFVLTAKSVLQQSLATDIAILTFLLKAVDDVDNPDDSIVDTSDLTEAQTALVEVDRLGRLGTEVKAYERYTAAIERFLDRSLAKSLKRRRRGEFERSGTEAKQDIFSVLPVFGTTHSAMAQRLRFLYRSVASFSSVDLTRLVSTKTVARVRSSLRRVLQGVRNQTISNTAVAVELLAGAAALNSVSNVRKVYDPAVDTGNLPLDRSIKISSEVAGAAAESIAGPFDLAALATPWVFSLTVDPEIDGGTAYAVTLPCVGASGRVWVMAKTGFPTYNILVGANHLYVQFDGIVPPSGASAMVRVVTLPTGPAVTMSAILSALNHVSTGLIDGTAAEVAPGTGRLLVYGSSSVTGITIKAVVPGTFDGSSNYVAATRSAHTILGFDDDHVSSASHTFSAQDLESLLGVSIPTASFVDTASASGGSDGALQVSSLSAALFSSLQFSGAIAAALGFSTGVYEAEPSYLEFVEDGIAIDPLSVGTYIGSLVAVSDVNPLSGRNISALVTAIEGTRMTFESRLPRCSQASVQSTAPVVFAVQKLINAVKPYVGSFEEDNLSLQRVLNPLLSRPTLAQMNDAKRVLQALSDRLDTLRILLSQIVVREDRRQFTLVARRIAASLEERGLDRALEFLDGGRFSVFFGLTAEVASKSDRFLTALEQVGRNDYATTIIEADMKDLEPIATTPDDLLRGEELPSR